MAIKIEASTARTATPEEVLDFFCDVPVRSYDRIAEGAVLLVALANDKKFLAERIVKSLKLHTQYSVQSHFVAKKSNWLIRANFWPSRSDSVYRSSGPRAFFYDVAHDHNFDLLTVGYFGPGYYSDQYEYCGEGILGEIGERVGLAPKGVDRLSAGEVRLYRQGVDVHTQIPPDAFSISLNVVSNSRTDLVSSDQFMLDVASESITRSGCRDSLLVLCEAAKHIGDDECRDLLARLSRTHPYDRGRIAAFEALVHLSPNDAGDIYARAMSTGSPRIVAWAKSNAARLER